MKDVTGDHPDQSPLQNPPLTSSPRITCLPLTPADAVPAARLYTEVFLADEPTTRHFTPDFSRFLSYATEYVKILVRKDLSFIVRDEETGHAAGFIFCCDLTDDPEQEGPVMVEFLSQFRETVIMIEELENRVFSQEEVSPGSVLHVYQIGVSRSFRRAGVARAMIDRVVSHAQERGFSRVVAECTGPASKRAFTQCGFHEAGYYPYDEFCIDGDRFFKELDQGLSLMVRNLDPPGRSHRITGSQGDRRDDHEPCIFCTRDPGEIACENDQAYARFDKNPVSPGHLLIIPKRHIQSVFEATSGERAALWDLVTIAKHHLDDRFSPDGYNIGINDGMAAGQTILHLHIHLIPRYTGDLPDPRGGVRGVIPHKQQYW